VVGARVKTQTPIGLADQVEAVEKIRATNRKKVQCNTINTKFNLAPVAMEEDANNGGTCRIWQGAEF
jgi:hypothetical protein